jgi:uncharacterized Ntn-hydrolase superfamily protein
MWSRFSAAGTALSSSSQPAQNELVRLLMQIAMAAAAGGPQRGSASVALEEARQMTGTMHVADHQGDTTHTWDSADPTTVREIEEIFREAQATGRLVYRQTSDGRGEQVRLDTWNPEEHTELFVAPRLAGG